MSMRQRNMIRFVFVVPLLLIASAASAQQSGHDACARDVSRFCRAQMSEGDGPVLGCLKTNRARLSKACQKVLTDHGQ
jgi:hypothetical protein